MVFHCAVSCCFIVVSCYFITISLLFHAVSLLFHCCFIAVSLLFHCCFIAVSLLFHCCFMLFHCCFTVFHRSVSWFSRCFIALFHPVSWPWNRCSGNEPLELHTPTCGLVDRWTCERAITGWRTNGRVWWWAGGWRGQSIRRQTGSATNRNGDNISLYHRQYTFNFAIIVMHFNTNMQVTLVNLIYYMIRNFIEKKIHKLVKTDM